MSTVMEKKEAQRLIDRMPPQATWDDLMHEIYFREGWTEYKALIEDENEDVGP